MWRKERLWNVCVLRRVHLSNFVSFGMQPVTYQGGARLYRLYYCRLFFFVRLLISWWKQYIRPQTPAVISYYLAPCCVSVGRRSFQARSLCYSCVQFFLKFRQILQASIYDIPLLLPFILLATLAHLQGRREDVLLHKGAYQRGRMWPETEISVPISIAFR
jgi:hypothetical protein